MKVKRRVAGPQCAAALLVLGTGWLSAFQSGMSEERVETTQDVVRALVVDADADAFGVSTEDWQAITKDSLLIPRRGARGAGGENVPPGQWCALGRAEHAGVSVEAAFCPLRFEPPVACRLEQLHRVVASPARPSDMFDAVAAALTSRHGRPSWSLSGGPSSDSPGRSLLPMDAWAGLSMSGWRRASLWQLPESQMWAFIEDEAVHVVRRSAVLTRSLAHRPLWSLRFRWGYRRVDWDLAEALRADAPEASRLILTGVAGVEQARLLSIVQALLERATAAGGDPRSRLILGASLLMDRVRVSGERPPGERPEFEALIALGVKFERQQFGVDTWAYDHGLWDQVIAEYPSSPWGHAASVSRLESGWSRTCGDDYRDVIREGAAWMRRHADSTWAPLASFAIAKAYETWWSLGQAPDGQEAFVHASEHADGSAAARAEAIRWFERVAQTAPNTDEGLAAQQALVFLRTGIDSGERRYFCRMP